MNVGYAYTLVGNPIIKILDTPLQMVNIHTQLHYLKSINIYFDTCSYTVLHGTMKIYSSITKGNNNVTCTHYKIKRI